MVHAGGGLLVLLLNTVLGVYKPGGMTRYGRRKRHERRTVSQPIPRRRQTIARSKSKEDRHIAGLPSRPESNDAADVGSDRGSTTRAPWKLYVLLAIIGLVLLFIVLHLTGGDVPGH